MLGIDVVRLGPNQSSPQERDLIAEVTQTKGRMWTSTIVNGFLFREEVPGAFNTIEEALEATKRFVASKRPKVLYYRQKSEGRKIIRKRRYVRPR